MTLQAQKEGYQEHSDKRVSCPWFDFMCSEFSFEH